MVSVILVLTRFTIYKSSKDSKKTMHLSNNLFPFNMEIAKKVKILLFGEEDFYMPRQKYK